MDGWMVGWLVGGKVARFMSIIYRHACMQATILLGHDDGHGLAQLNGVIKGIDANLLRSIEFMFDL